MSCLELRELYVLVPIRANLKISRWFREFGVLALRRSHGCSIPLFQWCNETCSRHKLDRSELDDLLAQNIQLPVKVPCSIPHTFNMQTDLHFRVFASRHKFYFRVLPLITGFSSFFFARHHKF